MQQVNGFFLYTRRAQSLKNLKAQSLKNQHLSQSTLQIHSHNPSCAAAYTRSPHAAPSPARSCSTSTLHHHTTSTQSLGQLRAPSSAPDPAPTAVNRVSIRTRKNLKTAEKETETDRGKA